MISVHAALYLAVIFCLKGIVRDNLKLVQYLKMCYCTKNYD
jgi:hypothetical protein